MFLAGGMQGGLVLAVVNVDDTTINKGTVVSLKPDADRSYAISNSSFVGTIDRSQGYNTYPTILIPVVPWVTSTDDRPLGVTTKNMKSGEHGTIIHAGVALVKTDGNVGQGNDLMVSTGGILIPSTTGNVVRGIAICDDFVFPETVDQGSAITDTFTWAVLNFLKQLTTP